MQSVPLEALFKAGLSAAAFERLNFFPNGQSNLQANLKATRPSGRTSLYDAVFVGIKRLLELYSLLAKLQTSSIWNFVHIIVTDGEDTSSRSQIKELLGMLMFIGMTLQKTVLKTWFIGVDLGSNSQAQRDLMTLSAVGGENSDFMNISDLEIGKVFEKIKVELGMVKNIGMFQKGNVLAVAQKNMLHINVKKEKYVVLFTLDKSESMLGSKWSKLCQGVENFMKGLDENDLVGCTIFNESVSILDNSLPKSDDDDDDENEGVLLLKALLALSLGKK